MKTEASKKFFNEETFGDGIMHSIHILYFTLQKRLEHVLAEKKQVTFSQFMVMLGLFCKDSEETSGITQAKLAERLMLTEATVSRHIRTLVDRKILTKGKDITNNKSYKLSLTPLGIQAYKSAKNTINAELEEHFAVLSDKEKNSIIASFSLVTASILKKN